MVDILSIGRRLRYRVHRAVGHIRTDGHFHPEVPLVWIFRLMRMRIALLCAILGRGRGVIFPIEWTDSLSYGRSAFTVLFTWKTARRRLIRYV